MTERKRINLALQGGGAHGAYTWGVIDRLLECGRFDIDAITGTSAGALNAVVLTSGMEAGGPDGARESLEKFWRSVSRQASFSPLRRSPIDVALGRWSLDLSPAYMALDIVSRFASPYELNPLRINPLRGIVDQCVDFERIHRCSKLKLFVAATNVYTGKIRVFSGRDVTLDAAMASACLPQLFHAVEIDGEPYWDGGFMGNPPLFPLFYETKTPDVVLVQINPIERRETPRTARDIANRINEITFNSTLIRELRAIEFVGRLIEQDRLSTDAYMKVRMHRIAAEELKPLKASSKFNAEWAFLSELKRIGRQAADQWMDTHYDAVGNRATIDVRLELG